MMMLNLINRKLVIIKYNVYWIADYHFQIKHLDNFLRNNTRTTLREHCYFL